METQADTQDAPAATRFLERWEGLKRRVISGVVMAILALLAVWIGGIWFSALVLLAALQMIREWDGLTASEPGYGWKLGGLFYVAIPCAALLWLRGAFLPGASYAGRSLVLYVILVVAATDIAAYFAGKQIGGPKLAPVISPKKTWAGLAGGMIGAGIVGGLCSSFTPFPSTFLGAAWMGAFLAVAAQAGDLFESWLKRRAGVKDSGVLIPGHGGLLDRLDGYLTAIPVFALMAAF